MNPCVLAVANNDVDTTAWPNAFSDALDDRDHVPGIGGDHGRYVGVPETVAVFGECQYGLG